MINVHFWPNIFFISLIASPSSFLLPPSFFPLPSSPSLLTPRGLLQNFQHLLMYPAVTTEYFLIIDAETDTAEIRDYASGLAHDQTARCHIPGLKFQFPVAVQSPGRHRAQVERG